MKSESMKNEIISITEGTMGKSAVIAGLTASNKPTFKINCNGGKTFNILEENLVKSGLDKSALVVGATFTAYYNELPLKSGGVTRWINKLDIGAKPEVEDVDDGTAFPPTEQEIKQAVVAKGTNLNPVLAYVAIEIALEVAKSYSSPDSPMDVDGIIGEFDSVYGQLEHKYGV
jgi:hypothetical protein